MDFLSWLPDLLTKLAFELFSEKHKLSEERKERLAQLIERISDCTSEIADAISDGKLATSQCSELTIYLEDIQTLASEVAGVDTASRLMFWINHVDAVPSYAKRDIEQDLKSEVKPSRWGAKRKMQSRDVRAVSGKLKALANLLRV